MKVFHSFSRCVDGCALALILALTVPAQANFLMVDFGDVGQVVQTGWEEASRVGGGDNENELPSTLLAHTDNTPYGTVTHSIGVAGVPSGTGLDYRDRQGIFTGSYVHPTLGQVGNVIQDCIRTRDYGQPDGGESHLELIFTGLNAGGYEITTFHNDYFGDSSYTWSDFDISVEVGAGNGFTTAHSGVSAPSTDGQIVDPAWYVTPFTSTGPSDEITVRISPIAGTAGGNEISTSGFALGIIPEPSTAILLSMGVFGILRRRNK